MDRVLFFCTVIIFWGCGQCLSLDLVFAEENFLFPAPTVFLCLLLFSHWVAPVPIFVPWFAGGGRVLALHMDLS